MREPSMSRESQDRVNRDAAELLKSVSYFSTLDRAGRNLVARSAVQREYQAGQVVFLEGERSEGLHVVRSGWLKAAKTGPDGREQVLQMLRAGDAFNIVGVFTDEPNQATVTALEASRVWIVRREVLLSLLDAHPELARRVVADLAGRVMHLVRMVEDLSLRSVEARLARLLLEQAEGRIVERRRWATQAELAARLGTVADVVNRALRKLAEQRMILVDRRQIRILDEEGLQRIARVVER
jgi:CRP/FNR family transcriptional regulator